LARIQQTSDVGQLRAMHPEHNLGLFLVLLHEAIRGVVREVVRLRVRLGHLLVALK
jgi:hypothetical protein